MTVTLDRYDSPRPVAKDGIMAISAYTPGKSGAAGISHPIKLSANENVLGCSPLAKAAYADVAERLHLYPDGRSTMIRDAIAQRHKLEPERLMFGCGSDEIFALLNQAYLEPGDNIVQGCHGFAAYGIGARACQAEVRMAAEPNLTVDVDLLLAQVTERTRVVFLANPANPTGTWLPGVSVRRLHAGLPPSVILVLDGAYAEFLNDPDYEDGLALARDTENVVVTRTFSKIHGLAALRVGWAYMPRTIHEAVDRIRLPFNVNIPAQFAAVAALGDEVFQDQSRALVAEERPKLAQNLTQLGLEVVPGAGANFLLVKVPTSGGRTALEAEAYLAARGIMVRYVGNYGLPDYLRITIGRPEHNWALLGALATYVQG